MRRPPGSGTAAAFATVWGSEPIRLTLSFELGGRGLGCVLVVAVPEAPLPQAVTPSARTASSASEDLATQPDLPDDSGLLFVRRPARIDRSLPAVREPA